MEENEKENINMKNVIGEIVYNKKIIPKNYGSIKHLMGSKMRDIYDIQLDSRIQKFFLENLQFPDRDEVIITEKVDGSNVGVVKKNDKLYPITRKGYDVRDLHDKNGNKVLFLLYFAKYVEDNQDKFYSLLRNGERCVCEWMIRTHTIPYILDSEPLFLLDIVNCETKKRESYDNLKQRAYKNGFNIPPEIFRSTEGTNTLSLNELQTKIKYSLVNKTKTQDIEGFVWRYQRDGKFYNSAKFVNGFIQPIHREINENVWNGWSGKFMPEINRVNAQINK